MPDSHNVILVDGTYADVSDVNDVYVASIESRLEKQMVNMMWKIMAEM